MHEVPYLAIYYSSHTQSSLSLPLSFSLTGVNASLLYSNPFKTLKSQITPEFAHQQGFLSERINADAFDFMEVTASVAAASCVSSLSMSASRKEWQVVTESHSVRSPGDEELEWSKLGKSDKRTIYEVHCVGLICHWCAQTIIHIC